MLARKWRPKGFDDVVGQEHVTRTLKNAIETGRVAHAYLFVGPRGIGKTSLARIFAKALDCEKGPTTAPCSACSMCREIAAGNALDVLEIDGASNNGVDQVRDLRDQVQFAPTHGTFKIIIIDEVHMLSTAAFNALLKTLEEPPPHVKFIFATTEGDKVLPTIISRCQRFDLRRIQTPLIVERLRHICTAEHITIDDDALLAVARGAEGGMRDALSALDQLISFKGDALTEEDVLAVFGLVSRRSLEGLASAVLKGDMPEILRLVAMFDSAGKDMRRLTVELMESFRNLLIYQYVGEAMSTLDATPEQVRTLAEQASLADASRVQQIADQLAEMEGRLRFALSVRTLIEMTLIRCARIANAVSLEEVLRRLNALRSDEPQAPANKPAVPAARPADLYDDPVLKQVLQEFDGKIVGVEDGDD
ncbi:MAG TPA: DNA polymerase III subunit gamma/tau [Kiritimatiellia bacterium]|nr:DNA polymerase III subunit gamma/tau [Kiritimatiellia bacterium]HQA38229.1 DNA polymerase III subunit gamma/tau [Kiritimatiellia bacterium]HQL50512.1 DNA polymerase III subunit gamma/tau [Kiritimatiellia bacterium]